MTDREYARRLERQGEAARRTPHPTCRPCLHDQHTDCHGHVTTTGHACGCDEGTCMGFGI